MLRFVLTGIDSEDSAVHWRQIDPGRQIDGVWGDGTNARRNNFRKLS
jgi:hypothetical protein